MRIVTSLMIEVDYTCYHDTEEEISYERNIIVFKDPDVLKDILIDREVNFGKFIEEVASK